jgi:hypothetical protein
MVENYKEWVMKRFLAIGLVMLWATVVAGQAGGEGAHGQAACTLTIAQAPVVGGLRLGMTPEEVLALFPGSSADNEVRSQISRPASALGVASFTLNPGKYGSKAAYVGISHITVSLLDNRVSNFNIGYNGPEWKHVDQFVAKFIKGTNLPPAEAWEAYVGMDTQLKTLKCNGFEISIFAGGTGSEINYVLMRDLEAQKKLKERRAKANEKNWWGTSHH